MLGVLKSLRLLPFKAITLNIHARGLSNPNYTLYSACYNYISVCMCNAEKGILRVYIISLDGFYEKAIQT